MPISVTTIMALVPLSLPGGTQGSADTSALSFAMCDILESNDVTLLHLAPHLSEKVTDLKPTWQIDLLTIIQCDKEPISFKDLLL